MKHAASTDDRQFRGAFESCTFPKAEFNHRAHLRLAYTYLVDFETEAALQRMKDAIFGFLLHHGIDPRKYHETLTRAWIMAVRHFMEKPPVATSFDEFAAQNPVMLDSKVMLTHYSSAHLFSDDARSTFVEPDLDPIPRYRD